MASIAGASATRVAVAEEDDHVCRAGASVGCQNGLRRGDRVGVIGAEPTNVIEPLGAASSPASGCLHEIGGGIDGRRVRRAVIARQWNDLVEWLDSDRVAIDDASAGHVRAHHRRRGGDRRNVGPVRNGQWVLRVAHKCRRPDVEGRRRGEMQRGAAARRRGVRRTRAPRVSRCDFNWRAGAAIVFVGGLAWI